MRHTRATLVMAIVSIMAWYGNAYAGNANLDTMGIRIDNVKLNGTAVDNTTYWLDPPFLSAKVTPNVLFVLDNSGSMNDQAYAGAFDPAQFVSGNYFGYAEPGKCYQFGVSGQTWDIIGDADPTKGCDAFAGVATTDKPVMHANFLNWATTRRVDAAKKLLIGGKANPRSQANCCVKLTGEDSSGTWDFGKNFDDSAMPGVVYPFSGAYRYNMAGNNLSATPLNFVNLLPIANDSVAASWTITGATSAWDAVDDATPDGNATTIQNRSTASAPALFDYNYTGPGGLPAITSVQVIIRARKTDNVTMRIQGVLKLSGTNYAANYQNIGSQNYSNYTFEWTKNPATGGNWAWSDIKSSGAAALSAFGVQAYTTPTADRYPVITQVYLKVNWNMPAGGPWSVVIDSAKKDVRGIMDELSNDARFGLAFYNQGDGLESSSTGSANAGDGAHIDTYIDFGTPTNMITAIGNMSPHTWTPLAETLYEMLGYFRQDAAYYTANSPEDYKTGLSYDPYYYRYALVSGSTLTNQYVPCAKSFILMLTDGESTQDKNIPAWLQDYDNDGNDPDPDPRYGSYGSDYLDDVALWGRKNDVRPGTCTTVSDTAFSKCIPGNQNVLLYSVFMFGRGSQLLMDASINGGFDDLDGDGTPGCTKTNPTQDQLKECYRDSNGNGTFDPVSASNPTGDLPLTYFQGDDGYELYTSIIDAITAILKRAASGTSVSVLGSSWKGEGSMYQAYFYPEKVEGLRRVKWTGYFHSLFVDRHGLIHEDTNGDGIMRPDQDYVVEFEFQSGSDTKIKYFRDVHNNADPSDNHPDGKVDTSIPIQIIAITDAKPLWDAGKMLALRDPADRSIYTSLDADTASPPTTPPTVIPFNTTVAADVAAMRPFLRTKTNADAEKLINFVRGAEVAGWRDRRLTVNGTLTTWKLGDIVFSDPVVVAAPKERFDIIYNDQTYAAFYNKWSKRRNVVYVGGNDGMLHAFNGGYYISTTDSNPLSNVPQVTFCTALHATDPKICGPNDASKPLGKELWGFIPPDVLPHLAWMADPDYQHVFYVDNMVRVTDARIFTPDADHPNGWGTVLIASLRFGGGEIDVTDTFGGVANTTKQFKSAYYALDVTNPDLPPKLLWRFTDKELGFSMSVPTVVRQAVSGVDYWYLAMGSGPSNFKGGRAVDNTTTNTKFTSASIVSALPASMRMSSTNPHLFIIDMKTGSANSSWTAAAGERKGVIRDTSVSNRFVTSVTAVDFPLDFKYDMIYYGNVGCNTACTADGYIDTKNGGYWGGRLSRVKTFNDKDPGNWIMSDAFYTAQPITVKPAVGVDKRGNIWVYFGTGRFLHVDDRFDTTAQHYYGIKDRCYMTGCPSTSTLISNSTNLLYSNEYNVLADGTLGKTLTAGTFGTGKPSADINRFDDLADYMQRAGEGWKVNLGASERVIVNGFVVGGISGFGSYTPTTSICEFEGRSKQYYPYYLTGTVPYIPGGTYVSSISVDSGSGLPSIPAVHIDSAGNVKLFLQKSTGEIQVLEMEQAQSVTGGLGAGGECN